MTEEEIVRLIALYNEFKNAAHEVVWSVLMKQVQVLMLQSTILLLFGCIMLGYFSRKKRDISDSSNIFLVYTAFEWISILIITISVAYTLGLIINPEYFAMMSLTKIIN